MAPDRRRWHQCEAGMRTHHTPRPQAAEQQPNSTRAASEQQPNTRFGTHGGTHSAHQACTRHTRRRANRHNTHKRAAGHSTH
eukprot:2468328-Prymnesium_polylepis.1